MNQIKEDVFKDTVMCEGKVLQALDWFQAHLV